MVINTLEQSPCLVGPAPEFDALAHSAWPPMAPGCALVLSGREPWMSVRAVSAAGSALEWGEDEVAA